MDKKYRISMAVLILAVLLILIGCLRGELQVVLGKAATVCLECIGLG